MRGQHRGWICILSAKRIAEPLLLLHELAHLITGVGHEDQFRRVLLAIGGTLDRFPGVKDYHKRERGYRDPRRPHLGHNHHAACPCGVKS